MREKLRFLGDVHAETIAVAIAEPDGEVCSLGTIATTARTKGRPRSPVSHRVIVSPENSGKMPKSPRFHWLPSIAGSTICA